MPDDVFIAINGDALLAKSKIYIGRAVSRKSAGDLDEYQLWASLALELLGNLPLPGKVVFAKADVALRSNEAASVGPPHGGLYVLGSGSRT